jgi:nucleoside-diphosphate-sugar epimerase
MRRDLRRPGEREGRLGSSVVVIGATGPLGRRVTGRLAADGYDVRAVAAGARDVVAAVDGADAVVVLGRVVRASQAVDGTGVVALGAAATDELLAALAAVGAPTVVWLSTAMVYGAWPDNPIPITETAPLRPNPGVRFAEDRAERDRVVGAWAQDHRTTRVVVLRPTVTVGSDGGWLRRSPWRPGVRVDDTESPSQFVRVDDLAAAIALAVTDPLRGTYNVAPDGWIPAEQLRALCGPAPRIHLPTPVAERVARLRWRIGGAGASPAVLAYARHPWVVANDRIRAAGWDPEDDNEEAFVLSDDGGRLAGMSARTRQLVSLGVTGALLAVLVAVVATLLARSRRRRT